MWKIAAHSKIGRHHEQEGLPCQDSFRHATGLGQNGDGVLAIVADGAGCARLSDRGAQLACELCFTFLTDFMKRTDQLDENDFREVFGNVALALESVARAEEIEPDDFSTTLNVLVLSEHETWNASIGDSGALIWQEDDHYRIPSAPSRGKYANETVFLRSDTVDDFLEVTCVREPVKGFISATDGIFDIILRRQEISAHNTSKFFDTLGNRSVAEAEKAFDDFFGSEGLAQQTADDLTVIVGINESESA